jgi:hypothetical protein
MSTANVPRGPGLFEVTRASGERAVTNVRRLAGAERQPGTLLIGFAAWLLALIGAGALFVSFSAQHAYVFHVRHQNIASVIEALLLDLLMIVFTLLALGLSRAGKSSRTERALILACAAASAYMNVSAADTASPRSVVAYAVAPVALAVVVDRVVAVIRRHVLGQDEGSAWTVAGRASVAAARLAGLTLLYLLRFALAAPSTARGLRQVVLDAAPLPGVITAQVLAGDQGPEPERPGTRLLAAYRAHPEYGVRSAAARIATELAPQAGLEPGTARMVIYAEIERLDGTDHTAGEVSAS